MKPRIFFHVQFSEGLSIASRLQKEGHKVYMYIHDEHYKDIYDGMGITKIDDIHDWINMITAKDLVVFDLSGSGELADGLRRKGMKVFNGGVFQDKLEKDRMYGIQYMWDNGIETPITVPFKNKDEVIAFLDTPEGMAVDRWVYKGDDEGCSNTYCAHDKEDLVSFLENQAEGKKCILQEFVKGIAELSTEVWFSGGHPISPSNNTIETKAFMNEKFGRATGASSSLVWHHKGLDSLSVTNGIGKCFPDFLKRKFTGCIDLNAIITEDGSLLGLEWTPRWGYSAEPTLLQLIQEPLGELIEWACKGEEGLEMKPIIRDQYGLNLTISVDPYPLEGTKASEWMVLDIYKESKGRLIQCSNNKLTHDFMDIYQKDGNLYTGGHNGLILYLGTIDSNIKKGAERLLNCVRDDIRVIGKQVKTDGFDEALESLPKLKKLGYEII